MEELHDAHVAAWLQAGAWQHAVRMALVSPELRQAIQAILIHSRGCAFRWSDLLEETEEVLGEVTALALGHLGTYDPLRRPVPWLVGIAINVIRQRARWHRRMSRRPIQADMGENEWERVLEHLSVAPRELGEPHPVWQAIDRLSPARSQALHLRFVQGLPYDEIAPRLGTTEDAARARVWRALRSLRKLLNNLEQGDDE